jgi:hypothetical protein
LTIDRIKLRFKSPVIEPSAFTMAPNTKKAVSVNESIAPGIYEYKAELVTPPAAPGVQQLPKTYAQGHSSPKMIVDT